MDVDHVLTQCMVNRSRKSSAWVVVSHRQVNAGLRPCRKCPRLAFHFSPCTLYRLVIPFQYLRGFLQGRLFLRAQLYLYNPLNTPRIYDAGNAQAAVADAVIAGKQG